MPPRDLLVLAVVPGRGSVDHLVMPGSAMAAAVGSPRV
jgi:hypothetical protein